MKTKPTVYYVEVPEGEYRKSYEAPYMIVESESSNFYKYGEIDKEDMEFAKNEVNFVLWNPES
jgi:hypothetical protein